MSDELRRLEERLNSKLELQFELYNQGMTLLRNNLKGRLQEQEQRIQEAMLQVQGALSAQRHILEESLLQQQELFRNTNQEIRGALNESFTWLHSLDDRVSAIEKKLAG